MEDDEHRDPQARSSGEGIDVDQVWKARQSTIWDLRNDKHWDFSRTEDRNEARRKMKVLNPLLIVGNRVDTVLQNFTEEELNCMDKGTVMELKIRSNKHHRFLAEIYQMQEDNGRFFLHEAVLGLASTRGTRMEEIGNNENVYKTGLGEWGTDKSTGGLEMWTNGKGINESNKNWMK